MMSTRRVKHFAAIVFRKFMIKEHFVAVLRIIEVETTELLVETTIG